MQHAQKQPGLADLRFVSWLELALAGVSLRWHQMGVRVVVRLMDLQENQTWWGVTLDGRWLRDSSGAVTIFDSLSTAGHFLQLLKINRFNIREHYEHSPFVAGHPQEVYTLGQRCNCSQRGGCGATADQQIFHCPQLSQRRLAKSIPARQPEQPSASVAVVA